MWPTLCPRCLAHRWFRSPAPVDEVRVFLLSWGFSAFFSARMCRTVYGCDRPAHLGCCYVSMCSSFFFFTCGTWYMCTARFMCLFAV
ncbi:hypothetical protein BU14_0233s0017 [Porphyra umbilicalis]|uniref:Uncharacterized protein n=1 Tax=Porphyra umbilicalis TaxID=2786 RepID=A0A1X6P3S9_PORUM|nr:hypothetical protein BU14_0233s0017 [Porphyra umbilicalis]|eukprot:OSX75539.1 hypothetical protein BU14_0233s0017 [Porphyra umbilicalis]